MVRKKAGSKRVSLKDKYKIERKVREHHAKQRRETRRAGGSGKKMKKDPGIPNLWPWKEDMLQVRRDEEIKRGRGGDAGETRLLCRGCGVVMCCSACCSSVCIGHDPTM